MKLTSHAISVLRSTKRVNVWDARPKNALLGKMAAGQASKQFEQGHAARLPTQERLRASKLSSFLPHNTPRHWRPAWSRGPPCQNDRLRAPEPSSMNQSMHARLFRDSCAPSQQYLGLICTHEQQRTEHSMLHTALHTKQKPCMRMVYDFLKGML